MTTSRSDGGEGERRRSIVHRREEHREQPVHTMTMKIDLTTDDVTHRPSDLADPRTSMPSVAAIRPITTAMNGALMRPTRNVSTQMAL